MLLLPVSPFPPAVPALIQATVVPRTSPEVAALLPPPVIAGGYQIEFLDVGFASPQETSPDPTPNNARFYSRAAYHFTYRVSRTDGKPLADGEEEHVMFRGFSLPDDSRTDSVYQMRGSRGSTSGESLWSSEVDPGWKDVVSNWSVRSSDAPLEASGSTSSPVAWKGIPMPAEEGEKILVNQLQKTTIVPVVELESVERRNSRFYMHLVLRPQSEVGDYTLMPFQSQFTLTDGKEWASLGFSRPINQGDGSWTWTLSSGNPGKQKSFDFSTLLQESSTARRDPKLVKDIQVRLPVAPLLKVALPQKPAQVPPSAFAETTAPIKARLEWNERFSSQTDSLNLWISPAAPKATFQWWPESVTAVDEEGKQHNLRVGSKAFWHSDNAPQGSDESSWKIDSFEDWGSSKTMNVTVGMKQAQICDTLNRFAKIPLPPYGESREFSPNEFERETVTLRRIVWFTNPKDIKRFVDDPDNNYGARLALVFDYQPYTTGQQEPPRITHYNFDGIEPLEKAFIYSSRGDVGANGVAQPERIAFLLPMPARTAKTVSFSLKTHEIVFSQEPSFSLVFKGLAIPPKSETF